MAATKKREIEHKFLARIDNTPPAAGKPGNWDLVVAYSEAHGFSANDALNEIILEGLKGKKLL